MGRDRLRRGCSLEVIFEEGSDCCSQLDSLDPVLHPRRNQKGDFFSIDTLFSELSSTYQYSERHFYGEKVNEFQITSDGSLDFREMESCFVEWDEFSGDSLRSDPTMSFSSQEHLGNTSPGVSGRRSRVSRRQIVEASWIMDEEDLTTSVESLNNLNTKVGREANPFLDFDFTLDSSSLALTEETYAAIDQFDDQQHHEFSFSGPHNSSAPAIEPSPATPNKFRWNCSSSSKDESQKISESPPYANFPVSNGKSNSHEPSNSAAAVNNTNNIGDAVSSSTDVKRVRALFENSNSSASSSEDETNFSRKFNKANSSSSCKRLKENNSNLTANNNYNGSNSNNGTMRSAYSHLSLNQMDRSDFADLLVNDKVIIEDSPDVYQMFRLRHRDNLAGSNSKVSSSSFSLFSRNSTLRRSKSVGAGIHQLDEDENMSNIRNQNRNPSSSTEDLDLNKDRPCILAEEMPAPGSVRSVRTVFEQLYQKSRVNFPENGQPQPPSLSSIRSNPTSKILRSESMRNDFNRELPINTKPIILTNTNLPVKKTQEISKVFDQKNGDHIPIVLPCAKISKQKTTKSKVWPNVNQRQQLQHRTIEEVLDPEEDALISFSSITSTVDENEDRKLISPDVLNRIRSCGTTTTYFGGEIVAKTVKNRKMAVAPRKVDTESEFEPHSHSHSHSSSEISYSTEEIFFSARPNQNQNLTGEKLHTSSRSTNSRRPFDLQFRVDTAPRIISVLPKSQSNSNSPTKSNSPAGSLLEGRNSPEGCESQRENSTTPEWINDPIIPVESESPELKTNSTSTPEDSNNNSIKYAGEASVKSNKFSEAAEGAWF